MAGRKLQVDPKTKVTSGEVNRFWKGREYSGDRAPEFKTTICWIPEGSKVLDIGCGNGELGAHLMKLKKCKVAGIEIDEKRAKAAKKRGIRMVEGNADERLPFRDGSYDYVIATDVLEHLYHPDNLIGEMARVGKKAIIATPNAAYYVARGQLFFTGRVPRSLLFGYRWYDTEHIHMCSVKDLRELMSQKGMTIHRESYWTDGAPMSLAGAGPNFFAKVMMLEFSKR